MNNNPRILHHVIDYRGYKIGYSVYGQGDPIICLHGLNLDGRMFAGKNTKEMFKDKMIVALDLPGYGKSDFIPDAGIKDISAVITLTADALHLNLFELCGYCLGGIFALDYAIRNSGRINKLYLIETMIYLPWWLKLCSTPFFSVVYKWANRNRLGLSLVSLLPALKGLAKMQSLKLTPPIWNKPVNSFYISMMEEYQKINHLQRSRVVSCDTKLIYSGGSFKNVKRTSYELHAVIKKSTLCQVPTAAHLSLMFSWPKLV